MAASLVSTFSLNYSLSCLGKSGNSGIENCWPVIILNNQFLLYCMMLLMTENVTSPGDRINGKLMGNNVE
jgi:hypothetical protein